MKKYFLISLFVSLIMSCSNDNPIIEIEEPKPELNLAPNDFDISIDNISHSNATITWNQAVDPENDSVTYNIYLNQTLIIEGISELTYQLIDLTELTNYTGKIIAKDTNNNETTTTFSFQTEKYYLKYSKIFEYRTEFGGDTYSMIKALDGNYILTGKSFLNPHFQFFVLKIDPEGNEIWKKFYNYELFDSWLFNIIQINSGDYFITGEHHVLKLDNEGNEIWYKKIESYDIDDGSSEIKSIKADSNGNLYLVGGRGSSNSQIYQQAVLTKLDNLGNILWEKIFEPSRRNFFNDLVITSTNDLIILGSKETSSATDTSQEQIDFWVVKTNSDGNLIWEKSYGDGKYDFPQKIIKTNDGNFVFAGYSWGAYDNSDARLIKIGNNGNEIWNSTHDPNNLSIFSVVETSDGGFASTGYNFASDNSLVILKYDNNGNLLWEIMHYEFSVETTGKSILQTEDEGYLIAGTNYKKGTLGYPPKIWVIKTDPEGNYE
jgi:hypothetical protein